MSLINPAILWGFALVSIPVILHFLLRARPKKYLFPALRLIQARRTHNIRRLRLRHIWLLLLRMRTALNERKAEALRLYGETAARPRRERAQSAPQPAMR